jgi:hypothetical protein
MQRINVKHKDKETMREKGDTKQFYIGSSHNTGVVQSPCTSKGFQYNYSGLQISQGLFQETSQCSSTTARDFLALGHYLKSSFSRTNLRDFLLKNNSKKLLFALGKLIKTSLLNHN